MDLSILSFVGLGTYFGLIAVFLKSNPTSEVPRGIITPPWTLLSLYKALFEFVKSNTVVKSHALKSDDDVPISETISDATKLSPSAIKKNSKNNYG